MIFAGVAVFTRRGARARRQKSHPMNFPPMPYPVYPPQYQRYHEPPPFPSQQGNPPDSQREEDARAVQEKGDDPGGRSNRINWKSAEHRDGSFTPPTRSPPSNT
ncbi:MAG: hypothetical protein KAU14_05955 [Thermoplasmata archaeon]|nr:hypothetical protein [Thermoplasmata archaeon]